jgi:hypothetical protein
MTEGAFAFLDCLGFKGIWKRADASEVIKKLSSIEQQASGASAMVERFIESVDTLRITTHVASMSDSIAVSLRFEQKQEKISDWERGALVWGVSLAAVVILHRFLQDEPPLALRGCIAYGSHECNRTFVVGPAVDEAAEYMNLPQGAFVWLTPLAAKYYQTFASHIAEELPSLQSDAGFLDFLGRASETMPGTPIGAIYGALRALDSEKLGQILPLLANYILPAMVVNATMPIRGGQVLRCLMVNPLWSTPAPDERRKLIDLYSKTFAGGPLDVLLKWQNTVAFLEWLDQMCGNFWKGVGSPEKSQSRNQSEGEAS